jgi:hypothetical protein
MTILIPDGYAQGAWRFSLTGDPEVMVTTCGLAVVGSPQATADAFADTWLSEFPAANSADEWTFLGAVLRVGVASGPPVIVEAPRTVQGTQGGNPLPSNCSLLVRKQSALGGRQGRGRFYVPLVAINELDVNPNGIIVAEAVTALQGAWDRMHALISPVILHDGLSPDALPTPITRFVVQNQIATQRRRMRS